jgi:hypothetical protein
MRRMLRQAAHRATSTSLRLVDVALCRALAARMTTPQHRPAPPVDQPRAKIITRLVIPQIPGEDGDATMRRILDTMRAEGWGTAR